MNYGKLAKVKEKTMANKKFFLVMLVMALAFGLTAVGCDNISTGGNSDVDPALNGTWVTSIEEQIFEIKFNNGRFEASSEGVTIGKGTYFTNNGLITTTYTHVYGTIFDLDPKLYSRSELKIAFKDEADIDEELDFVFTPETNSYSVNGNTLTFISESGVAGTYTRK
jgi:hypothetical protein